MPIGKKQSYLRTILDKEIFSDKLAIAFLLLMTLSLGLFLRLYFVTHYSPYFIWGGDPMELHTAALGIKSFLTGHKEDLFKIYVSRLPLSEIFQRGPIYPAYLALIYMIGRVDFGLVGIIQCISDTLSIFLLFLITAKVFSPKTGLIASFIYAIYGPAIFSCGYILTENFCAFLLLTALLVLVYSLASASSICFILAGMVMALPCLCRPNLILLGLFLLPAIIFLSAKEKRLKVSIFFLTGHLLILGGWFIVSIYSGRTLLVNQGTGPREVYGGLNIADEGWFSDRYNIHPKPRSELTELIGDISGKPQPEVLKNLYQAGILTIKRYPFEVAYLVLKKIFWLWHRPYNYFFYQFPLPSNLLKGFHQVLVMLTFGFFLLIATQRKLAWLLISALVYTSLIHGLSISQLRYNLPFMPLIIALASYALFLIKEIKERKIWLVLGLGLMTMVLWLYPKYLWLGLLYKLLPVISPEILNWLLTLFLYTILALFLLYSMNTIKNNFIKKNYYYYHFADYFSPLFFSWSLIFPIMLFLVRDFGNHQWSTWSTDLQAGQSIQQKITITKAKKTIQPLALLIDMQELKTNPLGTIEILCNDQLLRKDVGHLFIDKSKFLPSNEIIMRWLLERRGKKFSNLRQWIKIPLKQDSIEQEFIEIDIKVIKPSSKDYRLRIWGDYPDRLEGKVFNGPAWGLHPEDTSIFRWWNLGDYRLNRKTKIYGLADKAILFDGQQRNLNDLSNSLGLQNGRFRIFLWAKDDSGEELFF